MLMYVLFSINPNYHIVAYIMLGLNDTVESTVSLWLLVKSFYRSIFSLLKPPFFLLKMTIWPS